MLVLSAGVFSSKYSRDKRRFAGLCPPFSAVESLSGVRETPLDNIIINADRLPVVEGHCDQFSLLFYHLISNSIQFRKEDGATKISIEADSIQQNRYRNIKGKYQYTDFVRITFSDNGKGFEPQYARYIFQLFEKAHPDAPGMGFGLALCKKIVENYYGSITAKSAVGEGARFTILLPVKHPGVVQN